jgi:hypothetical protein
MTTLTLAMKNSGSYRGRKIYSKGNFIGFITELIVLQFINDAIGRQEMPVGGGLKSCTVNVTATSPFKIDGQEVVLIDTPGCDGVGLYDILLEVSDYMSRR